MNKDIIEQTNGDLQLPSVGNIVLRFPPDPASSLWIKSSFWAASGLVCPGFGVVMATAAALPRRRPCYTFGPPRQLSAQFSCQKERKKVYYTIYINYGSLN